MRNNKGFTLVELIASFALALTMMFFLFQIVITVRDLYVSSGVKTELLIRQSNLLKKIGTELNEKALATVTSCGDDCYQFTYAGGITKELSVNRSTNVVSYDDYQMKLGDGSAIGEFSVNTTTIDGVAAGKKNSILIIKLPITNKISPSRDFGINLVYQYDNRTVNLGL